MILSRKANSRGGCKRPRRPVCVSAAGGKPWRRLSLPRRVETETLASARGEVGAKRLGAFANVCGRWCCARGNWDLKKRWEMQKPVSERERGVRRMFDDAQGNPRRAMGRSSELSKNEWRCI